MFLGVFISLWNFKREDYIRLVYCLDCLELKRFIEYVCMCMHMHIWKYIYAYRYRLFHIKFQYRQPQHFFRSAMTAIMKIFEINLKCLPFFLKGHRIGFIIMALKTYFMFRKQKIETYSQWSLQTFI